MLPGCNLSTGQGAHPVPYGLPEIRRALFDSATPDDVRAVYLALFTLTQPGAHGPEVQLDAIKLYLDRFFGKPVAYTNETRQTVQAKVSVDLSALTDDELRTYMDLQGKVQRLDTTPAPSDL